ncbi:MAG: hypothetical protein LBV00_07880 [Propionibacteriaceae bacterium]|jgi:hypothetical protein|nr:hypothetical protein [Propionibacteriaceae bacterium]
MRKIPTLALAFLLAATALSACSPPTTPSPTVTVTQTVTAGSTETASATTPAPPNSQNLGVIWSSSVDSSRVNQTEPPPSFPSNQGITTRIGLILYLDPSAKGPRGKDCADAIRQEGTGNETHCLEVQWEMDVPTDYPDEEAYIDAGALLTPAGKQIDQFVAASGIPGAKSVIFTVRYVGGEPGSTVRWKVGSNSLDYETFTFEIPNLDAFRPLTFD